jgi:hypothetical protein
VVVGKLFPTRHIEEKTKKEITEMEANTSKKQQTNSGEALVGKSVQVKGTIYAGLWAFVVAYDEASDTYQIAGGSVGYPGASLYRSDIRVPVDQTSMALADAGQQAIQNWEAYKKGPVVQDENGTTYFLPDPPVDPDSDARVKAANDALSAHLKTKAGQAEATMKSGDKVTYDVGGVKVSGFLLEPSPASMPRGWKVQTGYGDAYIPTEMLTPFQEDDAPSQPQENDPPKGSWAAARKAREAHSTTRVCPVCGGEGFGRGFDGDCPGCGGTGKVASSPVDQFQEKPGARAVAARAAVAVAPDRLGDARVQEAMKGWQECAQCGWSQNADGSPFQHYNGNLFCGSCLQRGNVRIMFEYNVEAVEELYTSHRISPWKAFELFSQLAQGPTTGIRRAKAQALFDEVRDSLIRMGGSFLEGPIQAPQPQVAGKDFVGFLLGEVDIQPQARWGTPATEKPSQGAQMLAQDLPAILEDFVKDGVGIAEALDRFAVSTPAELGELVGSLASQLPPNGKKDVVQHWATLLRIWSPQIYQARLEKEAQAEAELNAAHIMNLTGMPHTQVLAEYKVAKGVTPATEKPQEGHEEDDLDDVLAMLPQATQVAREVLGYELGKANNAEGVLAAIEAALDIIAQQKFFPQPYQGDHQQNWFSFFNSSMVKMVGLVPHGWGKQQEVMVGVWLDAVRAALKTLEPDQHISKGYNATTTLTDALKLVATAPDNVGYTRQATDCLEDLREVALKNWGTWQALTNFVETGNPRTMKPQCGLHQECPSLPYRPIMVGDTVCAIDPNRPGAIIGEVDEITGEPGQVCLWLNVQGHRHIRHSSWCHIVQ